MSRLQQMKKAVPVKKRMLEMFAARIKQ